MSTVKQYATAALAFAKAHWKAIALVVIGVAIGHFV